MMAKILLLRDSLIGLKRSLKRKFVLPLHYPSLGKERSYGCAAYYYYCLEHVSYVHFSQARLRDDHRF